MLDGDMYLMETQQGCQIEPRVARLCRARLKKARRPSNNTLNTHTYSNSAPPIYTRSIFPPPLLPFYLLSEAEAEPSFKMDATSLFI